jgi:hypothetical protein
LAESTKRQLVQQGGLDAVINTELRKLALGNKVCSKSEASLAECANEIVADLLLFHQQISPPDHSNDAASVWPIWAYGSAFTARLASRVGGRAVAELLLLLELMLPGTPLVYYGEETGQSDCRKCKVNRQKAVDYTVESVGVPNSKKTGTIRWCWLVRTILHLWRNQLPFGQLRVSSYDSLNAYMFFMF